MKIIRIIKKPPKKNNSLDKLAVARYNFGENIISTWDKEKQPDQWKRLNEIIEERNNLANKYGFLSFYLLNNLINYHNQSNNYHL